MTFTEAAVIGVAQILAMVPGTSRSGITMTAARALGYERTEAARFSFLLSIPTIAGAGLIAAIHIYKHGSSEMIHDAMMACGISFFTAILAVWFLMAWLRRSNFTLFAGYRILLGGFLLTLAYGYGW
jgi:undecaprenyl-diphosphatase